MQSMYTFGVHYALHTATRGTKQAHAQQCLQLRCKAAASPAPTARQTLPELQHDIDDELSKRSLELDDCGYFIILLDRKAREIVVDYYTNTINKNGIACDPDTGKPIPCTPGYRRLPSRTFRGSSAKHLSVELLETPGAAFCSRLEHANYLGRELQKAEFALLLDMEYVQD